VLEDVLVMVRKWEWWMVENGKEEKLETIKAMKRGSSDSDSFRKSGGSETVEEKKVKFG
jgi:hypothetical protein